MTKLLRLVAVAGLLLGSVHAAAAQTADEIVEKHLAAIGGRAALDKLTSRVMSGTFTVTTPGGEFSGPLEVMTQVPNKTRTLITLDLTGVGIGMVTIDQRFDGLTGYVLDSLQGNRDITGDQLEIMRNGFFPSPLMNYREHGVALELGGREKVGDRDAFLLNLKPMTGPPVRMYIDATTFMLLRQVVTADIPPLGPLEQTTDFSDERDVDGVKIAHRISSQSAAQSFSITVSKVEHNGALDQTLFAKPAN